VSSPNLQSICDLADRYDALVMVDDSHAVGFIGEMGRGTAEHCGRAGARRHHHRHPGQGARRRQRRLHLRQAKRWSTGCASAPAPTSSPTPSPPSIVSATIKVIVLDLAERPRAARPVLKANSEYFRTRMSAAGFTLAGRSRHHPGDAGRCRSWPRAWPSRCWPGIYVVGFSFPVVPKGQARIRTQMSAAHTREQLDKAIDAFIRIGRELGVI
jgi:glycine C-acetyltransferase